MLGEEILEITKLGPLGCSGVMPPLANLSVQIDFRSIVLPSAQR